MRNFRNRRRQAAPVDLYEELASLFWKNLVAEKGQDKAEWMLSAWVGSTDDKAMWIFHEALLDFFQEKLPEVLEWQPRLTMGDLAGYGASNDPVVTTITNCLLDNVGELLHNKFYTMFPQDEE